MNAVRFENGQRHAIGSLLKSAEANDQIIISDLDEIPNLDNVNFTSIKNKIIYLDKKCFIINLTLFRKHDLVWL